MWSTESCGGLYVSPSARIHRVPDYFFYDGGRKAFSVTSDIIYIIYSAYFSPPPDGVPGLLHPPLLVGETTPCIEVIERASLRLYCRPEWIGPGSTKWLGYT